MRTWGERRTSARTRSEAISLGRSPFPVHATHRHWFVAHSDRALRVSSLQGKAVAIPSA